MQISRQSVSPSSFTNYGTDFAKGIERRTDNAIVKWDKGVGDVEK